MLGECGLDAVGTISFNIRHYSFQLFYCLFVVGRLFSQLLIVLRVLDQTNDGCGVVLFYLVHFSRQWDFLD